MKRVVITGMGAISPVGNDIPTFWNNLKNGVCGIDTIRSFSTEDLPVKIAAEVKDFKPDTYGIDVATARKNDRYALFALAASNQAMKDSGLQIEPERLGVYIGSGIGGMNTLLQKPPK